MPTDRAIAIKAKRAAVRESRRLAAGAIVSTPLGLSITPGQLKARARTLCDYKRAEWKHMKEGNA